MDMTFNLKSITANLLPRPKSVHSTDGFCPIHHEVVCDLKMDDARLTRAVLRWREDIKQIIPASTLSQSTPGAKVKLTMNSDARIPREGYRLTLLPNRIDLAGYDAAGCFYGLQTLIQLAQMTALYGNHLDNFDGNTPPEIYLPCGIIEDQPDYHTRGLLQDITRGRVPTLDTLKTLVDRLAYLKINQLQLYIEHAFVFSFDPDICAHDEGLTPDEIHELDLYCRQRFIDLVPALATFGHMGRILSMPKYRHLAEIEATHEWSRMSWSKRMHGLTLDCMNPEAHRLVEMMWSDILDAFSSSTVNICGDEPWDLGTGKNRNRITDNNRGEVYLNHIRRTHEICASRGRRTQFWSDVVRHDPSIFCNIPNDSTILHWGYDDQADYTGTKRCTDNSLETFVCPGTSGWKRIINAMDVAERNIATFAKSGRQYGAAGLLNTDWGDHGHFNMLSCSWHGIALGASLGWCADHPTGTIFDKALMSCLFHIDNSTLMSHLRKVTRITNRGETWRWLYQPIKDVAHETSVLTLNHIEQLKHDAYTARQYTQHLAAKHRHISIDMNELTLALRFTGLLADKLKMIHTNEALSLPARNQWAEEIMETARAYADLWHVRSKPSGIDDILNALSLAAKKVQQQND